MTKNRIEILFLALLIYVPSFVSGQMNTDFEVQQRTEEAKSLVLASVRGTYLGC